MSNQEVIWSNILWKSRVPQALTALVAGAGLSVSGLQMQTVFRNPLAGPSILGINTGASLGVALVMLLGGGSITAGVFSISGRIDARFVSAKNAVANGGAGRNGGRNSKILGIPRLSARIG